MGQRWNLSTAEYRANFDSYVSQQILAGKRVVVEFVPETRSLDQNALINKLYEVVASQKQDETIREIRAHCKLHYGVPILRANNDKFREGYDRALKGLAYEDKLWVMEEFPVTRLMNKAQATEYIDTVIREYSKQGIQIVMPGEDWANF